MTLDLQTCWYVVLMLLITGYSILDGFDLGVGILHLFAKNDRQRRIQLNAIGPVWDGNEVWLVTAGGAYFAGFPIAYAMLTSAFYEPMLFLLTGLIFRACAIEFRSKHESTKWRQTWDISFSVASLIIAMSLGMIIGHLIQGLPIDHEAEIIREKFQFIQPYPILTGLLAVSLFAMHGCIYLLMKTEYLEHEQIRRLVKPSIIVFTLCYLIVTITTFVTMPFMLNPFKQYPWLSIIPIIGLTAITNIPRQIHLQKDLKAFICSSISIISLLTIFALGQFPYLVRSSLATQHHLHIYNASSSYKSLSILLLYVAIGIPFVLSYTCMIYWIFRGKVRLDSTSY